MADGVWRVRGGVPREMNVYLIEDDGGGVTVFDAGVAAWPRRSRPRRAALGGINRVVLGHATSTTAARRPARRAGLLPSGRPRDAEGDAGRTTSTSTGSRRTRGRVYPPTAADVGRRAGVIAGTIEEGEDVSGFRAVHLPGHAPGMIALFRERDGLALTADVFYTLDIQTGCHGPPRVAHAAFNQDTEQARASIRKLAELGAERGVAGHAEPLTRRRGGAARARRDG